VEEEASSIERMRADLDEYDRRNKEIARRLAERAEAAARRETAKAEPQAPASRNRAAVEALAGLENSEKLLRDLRDAGTPRAGGRTTPELTLILSSLPPERREIYERLLLGTPQTTPGEGDGVRSVSIAELNAEIAAAAREAAGAEADRIEREIRDGAEILRDRIERTIDRTERMRRGGQAGGRLPPRETPRLFHRRETQPGLPESGLARPPAGDAVRTNREEMVRESVTREERIDTEINRIVRETETKSMRDIDAAISRALSGRMRAMESRIYSGVERKLDIERARRGK
jgi:hypothetical protein